MSTAVNSTLSVIEQIFHDVVVVPSRDAALAALFYYVPVLGIWPLRPMVTALVSYFTEKAYALTVLTVDISAIRLLNEAHQAAYEAASLKLKLVVHDNGVSSDAYKKAMAEEAAALSQFCNFNR